MTRKYRTMKSIDELFADRLPDTELGMLTLINYSLECKGTLRHVMKKTKVWKRLIKLLNNSKEVVRDE
jgi:hypothetical protein